MTAIGVWMVLAANAVRAACRRRRRRSSATARRGRGVSLLAHDQPSARRRSHGRRRRSRYGPGYAGRAATGSLDAPPRRGPIHALTWNALWAVAGTAISALLILTGLRHFRRPIAPRTACSTKARN